MSELRSSPELRSLIEAARSDGPSATARAKVWGSLANTVGAGVTGGAAAVAAGTGSALGAAKLLVAGTLLGGAVTVGLAGAAVFLRPAKTVIPAVVDETAAAAGGPRAAFEAFEPAVVRSCSLGREALAVGAPSAVPSRTGMQGAASPATEHRHDAKIMARGAAPSAMATGGSRTLGGGLGAAPADDLGREAWLLAGARAALSSGDAALALRRVHATLALPDRQLVPEEMALEAQALRALGRRDEATAVEDRLRSKFPDSALAR